jgi:CHAD domain-containing protein
VLNAARLALAGTAIGRDDVPLRDADREAGVREGNFFSFFTIQSNILGVAALCLLVIVPRDRRTALFDGAGAAVLCLARLSGRMVLVCARPRRDRQLVPVSVRGRIESRVRKHGRAFGWFHDRDRARRGSAAVAREPQSRAPVGRYAEKAVEHNPERELKLAAAPGFRMPSIYGLVGPTVRQAPPERNETTYYDTEDLRLARWGTSLRHRPGEGWTVKLPAERDAPYLVRPEIVFEGRGEAPPDEAVELVRGFVRGAELREQVRMTTIRRRTGLHDAEGNLLAGVVDDSVSVQNDDRPPSAFRELEVEIGEETTPSLLDALVERLRQAGAGAPDQTAKYIRALPPDSVLTPEIEVAELGEDATAGDVVRRAIALSVIRLIRHDPVVRLDEDPEGVHQARVATRRLRSDLRTFRRLVDDAWSSSLRDELGWFAEILGDVRDGDVLLARLRESAAELPESEQQGAAAVLDTLENARNGAHETLLETLRSSRYLELLDRLVAAANAPVLSSKADERATEVVPDLVRRPWHKLAKRVDKLGESPSDKKLHRVRIRTKRVRYAAEAASAVVGKPARDFAKRASKLQDVLGDLNDAVVAERWLEEWAGRGRSPQEVSSAEALAARERSAAKPLREGWPDEWEELSKPKLRDWM